jgi:hypothetical protein
MPIHRDDYLLQVAELDAQDQIRFTTKFEALMGDLGRDAKALVGHLLGLCYDPFEHMLDFTGGEATCIDDRPGRFDRNSLDEPQDVVEYWAVKWSKHGNDHQPSHFAGTGLGLSAAWFRDVLRSKLVPVRLPVRLLTQYKDRSINADRAG